MSSPTLSLSLAAATLFLMLVPLVRRVARVPIRVPAPPRARSRRWTV